MDPAIPDPSPAIARQAIASAHARHTEKAAVYGPAGP